MTAMGAYSLPNRVLMGPGPSQVHPSVLVAMSQPLIGHLDPSFIQLMDRIAGMLRSIFQTDNELTFAASAPGSAGMEMCLVNLLEPGDTAVVCVNGVFGYRMCENVLRCGAELVRVEAPWGEPIDPQQVADALKSCNARLVAIVHAETSTGVLQPLEQISPLVHEAGALLVVDAVTSLGGVPVCVDEWDVDAVYSGTQKCLSAPPGLSPVSFSQRAVEMMDKRQSKVQSWFLDVNMIRDYVAGQQRAYHHTAPISQLYALHRALELVLEEGLEARFARHRRNHELLRDGLEALGFEFIVAPEVRLPQLNTVRIPAGVDDAATRRRLLEEYGIEVGAGLGDFAGKVWRIGLMGESCTVNHVNVLLSALKTIL